MSGFPTSKLRECLPHLYPEHLGVIGSPLRRKLVVGAGGAEHGMDDAFVNLDREYADGTTVERIVVNGQEREFLKVRGDARDLCHVFDYSQRFDLIFAHHVLEHIPHHEALDTLAHWVDRLNNGGLLYVCVPDLLWAMSAATRNVQMGEPHWRAVEEGRRWHGDGGEVDLRLAQDLAHGMDHKSVWWLAGLHEAFATAGMNDRKPLVLPRQSSHWLACCEAIVMGVKR